MKDRKYFEAKQKIRENKKLSFSEKCKQYNKLLKTYIDKIRKHKIGKTIVDIYGREVKIKKVHYSCDNGKYINVYYTGQSKLGYEIGVFGNHIIGGWRK